MARIGPFVYCKVIEYLVTNRKSASKAEGVDGNVLGSGQKNVGEALLLVFEQKRPGTVRTAGTKAGAKTQVRKANPGHPEARLPHGGKQKAGATRGGFMAETYSFALKGWHG
jgi:hypothetical protein